MSVVEDTGVEGEIPPEEPIAKTVARREAAQAVRGKPFSAGGVFRLILLAAIIAFLLLYVGPSELWATMLKVVIAVGLSAALFIGANLLFDQAYDRWSLFNGIVGAVTGFVGYAVLECNDLFRTLYDRRVNILGFGPYDINAWLWGAIGGAVLGVVMFLLSTPRQQLARLPLAVVGFTGFGFLTAFAFDESARPAFDWAKLWICVAVGVVLLGAIGYARGGSGRAPLSALTGLGIGWALGAWGGGDIGAGNLSGVLLATVVPAAVLGLRFGLATNPTAAGRRAIDRRSRAWIFLTPAMLFVIGGLVLPLIRNIYLSFFDQRGRNYIGWDNYKNVFTSRNSVNFDNWTNIFGSRLFWIALALIALGVLGGIVAGRRTQQGFERGGASLGPISIGFFILSIAILASVRGTIFNNIWWVIVVTVLATAIGLAVAVLADRSKGDQFAKSLIFLPMAISFVGAGIIWRFVYVSRDVSQDQTGVLNAFWVWVGEISNSTTGRAIAVAVLALIVLGLVAVIKYGFDRHSGPIAGAGLGFLLFVGYLIYRLLGPGLGGFVEADGEVTPRTVQFLSGEQPFNNMWLMVILIWIQTGFAMVILSAAIRTVPQELTEAAMVDGATESQVFWKVTIPQIAPTIGVVVTTLFVTVMKVFDIVLVTTGGNFGTQVIANEMFIRAFGQANFGLGAALATVLFLAVLPVMAINIRRIQKQRV